MGRTGRLIQEGSLYVLLFLLPFSKASVEISFGFLLLGWLLERLDPATRARTVWLTPPLQPVARAIIAYLAVCALSIAVSDFPMLSIRGLIDKWLEYLLFFVIVTDVATRRGVARRGVAVMAWSSLCVVTKAVSQEFTLATVPYRETLPVFHYGRMTGPYQNPIDLATYLMVVIPILLALWVTIRGWRRVALGGLLLLLIGCLARTQAVGAWLGLTVGLIVVAVIGADAAIRRFGWLALAAVIGGGALGLAAVGRLGHIFSMMDIGKVDRWVMWQAAIGMIRDRPILGHGVNTFMANYLRYWVGGEQQPRYAHNCYLQVAAETGLIGLAAFLWVLWGLFRRLAIGIRQRSDVELLLLGLSAGLFAFVAQAGIDTNFYSLKQSALFWVLSGVALGLSEQPHHR